MHLQFMLLHGFSLHKVYKFMKQINSSFGSGGMALAMSEVEFATFHHISDISSPNANQKGSKCHRPAAMWEGVGNGETSAGWFCFKSDCDI